jgi:hypothetical protein
MAYGDELIGNRVVERAVPVATVEQHDRVRWGPIFAGLVVALSTQLILSALGAALGSSSIAGSGAPRSNAPDVGAAVGIWSIVSLFIALFVGGWVTARSSLPMSKGAAMLNGAILWATTLAISAWLVSSGVSGAFGVAASNAGEVLNQVQGAVPDPAAVPDVTAQQARDIAGNIAKAGWAFTIGSLLGLAAAILGASMGKNRAVRTTNI